MPAVDSCSKQGYAMKHITEKREYKKTRYDLEFHDARYYVGRKDNFKKDNSDKDYFNRNSENEDSGYETNFDEKTVLKFALIIALVGILILFFLSETIKPKTQNIFDVKTKIDEDESVNIKGTVIDVQERKGVIIMNVSSLESIPVIVYEDMRKDSNLEKTDIDSMKNSIVEIQGKIKIFENRKEIVAEEIRSIN